MGKTIAIVQARMGSERFPGKMLKTLGSHKVLEWVLFRTQKAQCLDEVVLATTVLAHDDPLEEVAHEQGIEVYRGSESDVMSRYIEAANLFDAETIVRVCADNPFVAPEEIDRLVQFYDDSSCQYACNHQNYLGSNYADGLGAEIFSSAILQEVSNTVADMSVREHVTLGIKENPERYRLCAVPAPDNLAYPDLKFDIDTQSDLLALQRLLEKGVHINSKANEIVRIANLFA